MQHNHDPQGKHGSLKSSFGRCFAMSTDHVRGYATHRGPACDEGHVRKVSATATPQPPTVRLRTNGSRSVLTEQALRGPVPRSKRAPHPADYGERVEIHQSVLV